MLGNVLHTALSAVSAAGYAIAVTANNLANVNTDGFKSSRPVFTAQNPQTLDHGAAPLASSGGRNPVQVGRGVQLAEIAGDFSQGTVVPSPNPLDLALEGPGFFLVQGPAGETLYGRDGHFRLNADGELVTATGLRVLGHNVDGEFQLDTSRLAPLSIPRGPAESGATLTHLRVEENAVIRGHYSDGRIRDLGQIHLARFANPAGLVRRERNLYAAGHNSGRPTSASPGATRVLAGRELSNVSIGHELLQLNLFSSMYRVNLQVLSTGDDLLDELVNLRRP